MLSLADLLAREKRVGQNRADPAEGLHIYYTTAEDELRLTLLARAYARTGQLDYPSQQIVRTPLFVTTFGPWLRQRRTQAAYAEADVKDYLITLTNALLEARIFVLPSALSGPEIRRYAVSSGYETVLPRALLVHTIFGSCMSRRLFGEVGEAEPDVTGGVRWFDNLQLLSNSISASSAIFGQQLLRLRDVLADQLPVVKTQAQAWEIVWKLQHSIAAWVTLSKYCRPTLSVPFELLRKRIAQDHHINPLVLQLYDGIRMVQQRSLIATPQLVYSHTGPDHVDIQVIAAQYPVALPLLQTLRAYYWTGQLSLVDQVLVSSFHADSQDLTEEFGMIYDPLTSLCRTYLQPDMVADELALQALPELTVEENKLYRAFEFAIIGREITARLGRSFNYTRDDYQYLGANVYIHLAKFLGLDNYKSSNPANRKQSSAKVIRRAWKKLGPDLQHLRALAVILTLRQRYIGTGPVLLAEIHQYVQQQVEVPWSADEDGYIVEYLPLFQHHLNLLWGYLQDPDQAVHLAAAMPHSKLPKGLYVGLAVEPTYIKTLGLPETVGQLINHYTPPDYDTVINRLAHR